MAAGNRLTISLGLGPSVFEHKGRDRFGAAVPAPIALRELPAFRGDSLIPPGLEATCA